MFDSCHHSCQNDAGTSHNFLLIPLRRFFVHRKPQDFKRNFAYIILIGGLFPALGRTYIGWDNDEFCTLMPTNQKLNRVRIKDAQRELIKSQTVPSIFK